MSVGDILAHVTYFEIDADNWVTRQIEEYDDGPTLGYDSNLDNDEFGGLSTTQLDELEKYIPYSVDEFNTLWSRRSNG